MENRQTRKERVIMNEISDVQSWRLHFFYIKLLTYLKVPGCICDTKAFSLLFYSVHMYFIIISGSQFSKTCSLAVWFPLTLRDCLAIKGLKPICNPLSKAVNSTALEQKVLSLDALSSAQQICF